ncbi:MAG: RidA family protein [Acidimicrobiales bacterium]
MDVQGEPADHRLFDGVSYAYGAVAAQGAILFTAGACPIDEGGNLVGPGDLSAQAIAALENLKAALALHGAGTQDLVRTTVYVVGDHDALVRVWDVIATRLAPQRPPSTLLGVSVLGYRGQLVEIDGIAALPSTRQMGS